MNPLGWLIRVLKVSRRMLPPLQKRRWGAFGMALLLAVPVGAQKDQPGPPAFFNDTVEVRVINLEVVVTDHQGKRVAGLRPNDFQLLVDGTAVPIEFFTEIDAGRATLAAKQLDPPPAVPELPPGEHISTRYLVFIDDFFPVPAYRNRILDRLSEQIEVLAPEDHMAIVAFDGQQLALLSNWTRSLPQLRRAVDEAKLRPAFGLQRLAEQKRFTAVDRGLSHRGLSFSDIGFGGSRFNRRFLNSQGMLQARQVEEQVARMLTAAAATLRSFAKPAGRKVMLVLAGGWPAAADAWIAATGDVDSNYGSRFFAGRHNLTLLSDTANRLGYTIYGVDVPNAQSARAGRSAEFATLDAAIADEDTRFERKLNEQDSLRYLAAETGGRAFLEGASLEALASTAADTRSYYWLGLKPTWREDDQRHRLTVRVRGDRYQVRARSSFLDLSPQAESTMQVESAQLFGFPVPGSELKVQLGEPAAAGLGKVLLPVELEIPLDPLILLPARDGWSAHLELRVTAQEPDGDRADIPVIPIELSGNVKPQPKDVARYSTQLLLRRKPQELLLVLTDPTSGLNRSTRIAFRP